MLVRKVKESLRIGKTKGKALVVVGCRLALPPELEREFVVVQLALPVPLADTTSGTRSSRT